MAAAAAATALHVLDDAFLSREPGSTATDHLTSAGAILGLLAIGVLGFSRLRAGLQAVLALLLGLLADTLGTLELAGIATQGHAAAADVTGLISVVAGILALAVGAWTLWRSRRRTPSRARRYGRRALIAVGAAVALYVVVGPILFALGFTHMPRTTVDPAELGRPHETVTIRTSDGLDLAGWYLPSRNGAAVIAFPGRKGPVPHARLLAREGYGVLLLDMRGRGESEGDPHAFGWGSAKDVRAAIDFLTARSDVRAGRIGGLGLSVGGELLLETAAADSRLRAVVSEGAGMRVLDEGLHIPGASWLAIPQTVTLMGALRVISSDPPPRSLRELVQLIAPRPILLIEAGHGQGGEELNSVYYERAGEPKEYWLIPEARHTGGLTARPTEYAQRVVGFFDRYLLPDAGATP
jgi:dienelactone hydrolase